MHTKFSLFYRIATFAQSVMRPVVASYAFIYIAIKLDKNGDEMNAIWYEKRKIYCAGLWIKKLLKAQESFFILFSHFQRFISKTRFLWFSPHFLLSRWIFHLTPIHFRMYSNMNQHIECDMILCFVRLETFIVGLSSGWKNVCNFSVNKCNHLMHSFTATAAAHYFKGLFIVE